MFVVVFFRVLLLLLLLLWRWSCKHESYCRVDKELLSAVGGEEEEEREKERESEKAVVRAKLLNYIFANCANI